MSGLGEKQDVLITTKTLDQIFIQAVAWPLDGLWIPYTHLSTNIRDPRSGPDNSYGTSATPATIDIYNGHDGTYDSVLYYYDTTNDVIFWRWLIRGRPGTDSFGNNTYAVILDLEGNGFKRFFAEIDGNGTDSLKVFYGNTDVQNINDDSCADGEGLVWSETIVMGTNTRIIDDTGASGGYHVDMQIPLSAFDDCSGTQILTESTPFSFTFSTSTTTQNPTLKDLAGDFTYSMNALNPLPFGDPVSLTGGIVSDPQITYLSHTCGIETNYSNITITAKTLDSLVVSGGNIVDSIADVKFYYRRSGSGDSWTLIATDTIPVGLTEWSASWDTSALATTSFDIRVLATDDQSNTGENTSYSINLSNCNATLVDLVRFTATAQLNSMNIEWETLSELDTAGFHVWRSLRGREDYRRITPSMIYAIGGETYGSVYYFEDIDVIPGETYFYKLEDIEYTGLSTFNGPISATLGYIISLEPGDSEEIHARRIPTFSWYGEGFDLFRLEFSTQPDFNSPIISLPLSNTVWRTSVSHTWISGFSYTPTPEEWRSIQTLDKTKNLRYWRIVGKNRFDNRFISTPSELHLSSQLKRIKRIIK